MSRLAKAFSMAKKAYDAHQSSQRTGSTQASGSAGGSSWRSTIEGAIDQLGGGSRTGDARPAGVPAASRGVPPAARAGQAGAVPDADRQAIARYDYLMRTADPHQVEQVHAEAFERLTPAQRESVLQRMRADLPAGEQPRSADVADLSRAAGRSEARRPGSMRSVLAKVGTGGAVAGAAVGAAGLLGVVAAGAVASSVAGPLLDAANGVDFDALAGDLDLGGLADGVDLGALGVDDLASSVGDVGTEAVSGIGDQVSGLGDQVSGAGESLSDLAGGFDLRDLF